MNCEAHTLDFSLLLLWRHSLCNPTASLPLHVANASNCDQLFSLSEEGK